MWIPPWVWQLYLTDNDFCYVWNIKFPLILRFESQRVTLDLYCWEMAVPMKLGEGIEVNIYPCHAYCVVGRALKPQPHQINATHDFKPIPHSPPIFSFQIPATEWAMKEPPSFISQTPFPAVTLCLPLTWPHFPKDKQMAQNRRPCDWHQNQQCSHKGSSAQHGFLLAGVEVELL